MLVLRQCFGRVLRVRVGVVDLSDRVSTTTSSSSAAPW